LYITQTVWLLTDWRLWWCPVWSLVDDIWQHFSDNSTI